MGYREIRFAVADQLWSKLNKGYLLDDNCQLTAQKGLSSGEAIIHTVCAAIVEPGTHRMPPLDDLAFRLSPRFRAEVLRALSELLGEE